MGTCIDGKKIALDIKEEVKNEVIKANRKDVFPCLCVIQVGDNSASSVYVRNKIRTCEELGIKQKSYHMEENITESELLSIINEMNEDPAVHGILVQLPLPSHFNEEKVLLSISPDKDVDGFHPLNVGNLCIGKKAFRSCTPAGIIELLKRSGIPIAGKHCVIVGRSNIVGKPLMMMLLEEHGTVTVCHSKTSNMKEIVKTGDIVIVAIGKEEYITQEYIKDGAVVIDVGINRKKNGKLCGDVNFTEVEKKASYITPVPGGVGPMTIAMLMKNTLNSALGAYK